MAQSSTAGKRDQPWLFRTYAGHSSARASNELYRTNLARGQTGLSVAFDLPTQTGYDSDHPLAGGEVGKVGVPVPHLGEMRVLFDGIPLDTSLAILDALYAEFRDPNYAPAPLLRRMVSAERLGRKAGGGFYDYHRR